MCHYSPEEIRKALKEARKKVYDAVVESFRELEVCSDFRPELTLDDLEMDSSDLLALAVELEERFEIKEDSLDFGTNTTIDEIVNLVVRELAV